MSEKAFYSLAVSAMPAHVRVEPTQRSAARLFGPGSLRSPRWAFCGACKPELSAVALAAAGESRPVFQGELKSVDAGMLGQALYYVLMSMTATFFPATVAAARGGSSDAGAGVVPGPRVFYTAPPLGFALLAFPHVGYFISAEMIGKVLVAPASRPFFLGSEEHAAAAAALPCEPRGAPAWSYDAALDWRAAPGAGAPPRVAWASCADGLFRKIVRADARCAEAWAEMAGAYLALAPLLGDTAAAPPHRALARRTRLLFGAHEALVEMEALAGARASDAEVTGEAGGGARAAAILAAVAGALAWLALRGLLYTDLRGPNVLVSEEGGALEVRLVDYDDVVAVAQPVRSAAAFVEAIRRIESVRAERRGLSLTSPTFAARLAGGDFVRLRAALEEAFGRH